MNIVFDLGRVLIDWHPERAFAGHFDDPDQLAAWMQRVDFDGWNRLQDGGRDRAKGVAAARARHGDDALPLEGYARHFHLTIADPVPGSWDLIEALAARQTPLFAITNWSADCWPAALALYPRLTTIFADIVVSGQVGMLKPEPGIYELLLQRNGLRASDCLFIDDSPANVAGAQAVGMQALHFTGADDLAADLRQLGLLD